MSKLKIIVENRCLSLWSNLLEFVTGVERSKLLICLYAEVSKNCFLYSVKNQEMDTNAHPMFYHSEYNVIVVLYVRDVSWCLRCYVS